MGKVVVLAAWSWGLGSFLFPPAVPEPAIGRMVLLGLASVHAAEAFVFAKTLASEDGAAVGSHAGKLLMFGYFHVMGVRYG